MKRVITYELVMLALFVYGTFAAATAAWSGELSRFRLPVLCAMAGGIGGTLYCLRGVYLNACVRRNWDASWLPWYFLRPVTSAVSGSAAWLFLSAGLLVLQADAGQASGDIGFYALAFIAGLNVDRFLGRIEEVARATFGIEPSRSSRGEEQREAKR